MPLACPAPAPPHPPSEGSPAAPPPSCPRSSPSRGSMVLIRAASRQRPRAQAPLKILTMKTRVRNLLPILPALGCEALVAVRARGGPGPSWDSRGPCRREGRGEAGCAFTLVGAGPGLLASPVLAPAPWAPGRPVSAETSGGLAPEVPPEGLVTPAPPTQALPLRLSAPRSPAQGGWEACLSGPAPPPRRGPLGISVQSAEASPAALPLLAVTRPSPSSAPWPSAGTSCPGPAI